MVSGDYLASGATETTTTQPEGGYAYYNEGVLTLHNYSYEGPGYKYEPFLQRYALVYGALDITLVLEGENALTAQKSLSANGIFVHDLVIREGEGGGAVTITVDSVTSQDAIMTDGTMTIESGTINANAGDDGLSASLSVTINGGTININSIFGIYSFGPININGGNVDIDSADNGINSDGRVTISGGTVEINSQKDSGILGNDRDGPEGEKVGIRIIGGDIEIYAPCGLESEYFDIVITDGNIFIESLTPIRSSSRVNISGGNVELISTEVEEDEMFWAISAEIVTIATEDGLIALAATEPNGEFEPYDPEKNSTYDHILIGLAVTAFTVTFDPTGGVVEPESATTNEEGKLESLPTPERDEYSFDGWFTEAEGGVMVTEEYVFTEDTTIYAHWTYVGGEVPEAYTVTFDPTGGVVEPESATTNEEGKLEDLPTPERDEYSFDGWFTEAEGGEMVTEEYVFTEDTTIYAHWTYTGGDEPPVTSDARYIGLCIAVAAVSLMGIGGVAIYRKRKE